MTVTIPAGAVQVGNLVNVAATGSVFYDVTPPASILDWPPAGQPVPDSYLQNWYGGNAFQPYIETSYSAVVGTGVNTFTILNGTQFNLASTGPLPAVGGATQIASGSDQFTYAFSGGFTPSNVPASPEVVTVNFLPFKDTTGLGYGQGYLDNAGNKSLAETYSFTVERGMCTINSDTSQYPIAGNANESMFTTYLTGVTAVPVTFHYAITSGTAQLNSDFTLIDPTTGKQLGQTGTVTIPAGWESFPFVVNVPSAASADRSFSMTLSSPTNAALLYGLNQATYTIKAGTTAGRRAATAAAFSLPAASSGRAVPASLAAAVAAAPASDSSQKHKTSATDAVLATWMTVR